MSDDVCKSVGIQPDYYCDKHLNENEKEFKNSQYLAKLEKGSAQIDAGKGVVHGLIEAEDLK